jgi:para-nitrobenzyl esterase
MSDGNVERTADIEAPPVAQTALGQIRGYRDNGISVFKGVPYGAPTGGANRWLPPRVATPWNGIRETIELGDMCPQIFGAPMPEETAVLQRGPMSEDCLSLNVWTAEVGIRSGSRPVMVWFHGGAFSIGSGGTATNDGVNLASKNDVVVVTVNHRLNLFGFLDLADFAGPDYATSGNVGMLDCVAALRWVRENIANFGGDPGNVTIFGQSGGGMKVTTLMGMPVARGLFHRVIAQSGFSLAASPPEQATRLAGKALEALGVEPGRMEQLQAIPAERFVSVLESDPGMIFALGPVADGQTIPDDAASDGQNLSADIPMMIGTTETEIVFLPFAPTGPIDDAELFVSLKQYTTLEDDDLHRLIGAYRTEYPDHDNTYLYQVLASDWLLGADCVVTAERKANLRSAPAYVYYFTKHTPARGGVLRAPHTLDIPYVFDTLEQGLPIVGVATIDDQSLADRLSRTWATFAKTGDPNNSGMPDWRPYDVSTRSVMVLDDECSVVDDPHPRTRVLMAELKAKSSRSLVTLATGG